MLIAATHFNSDLYVVVATVLPVLYLALMLQASTYRHWWRVLGKDIQKAGGLFKQPDRNLRLRVLALLTGLLLTTQLAFVLGEGEALEAINKQHAGSLQHGVVWISVLVMLGAVAFTSLQYVLMPDETPKSVSNRY